MRHVKVENRGGRARSSKALVATAQTSCTDIVSKYKREKIEQNESFTEIEGTGWICEKSRGFFFFFF